MARSPAAGASPSCAAGAIRRENWRMLELSRLAWHLPPAERTRAVAASAIVTPER